MNKMTPGSPGDILPVSPLIHQLLFDIGGVLISLRPEQREICFRERFNITFDHFMNFLTSGLPELFNCGLIDEDSFHKRSQDFLKTDFRKSEFRECWNKLIDMPIVANFAVAEKLANGGFRVGILSNTDPWHWKCISHSFPTIKRFAPVFTSYELGLQKPTPELYHAVADKLELKPQSILLIDDSEANIRIAAGCGWQTHHFTSSPRLHSFLHSLMPHE